MATKNISTKELDELCQKYSEGDLDRTPRQLIEKISFVLNSKDLSEGEHTNLIKYKSSLEQHIANYEEALKNLNLGIPEANDKLSEVKLNLRNAFNFTISELKRDYVDKIEKTRYILSQNNIIIEPEAGQSHLSQSCSQLIEQYFSYLNNVEKEDDFWNQLKSFYEEISKVKVRYELENLPDEVSSVKNNIEISKRKEEAIRNNSDDEARNIRNSIKMHYLEFIILVARIKEKALDVENRKFLDINPNWIISFLDKYYEVILKAGGLEEHVHSLSHKIESRDIILIKNNIFRQKIILDQILRELGSLNNLDQGMNSDFRQNIHNIITLAKDLKSFYGNEVELQANPTKVFDFHDPFQAQILNLYEETIKRK